MVEVVKFDISIPHLFFTRDEEKENNLDIVGRSEKSLLTHWLCQYLGLMQG